MSYLRLNKNHIKKSTDIILKSLGIRTVGATGLCHDAVVQSISDLVRESIDSGMSTAVVNGDGDILAQILNAKLYDFHQVANYHLNLDDPVDNFIHKASNMSFTSDPMDVLYTYKISSDKSYTKHKYARYLVEKTIEDARESGFKSIVTDCTDREYRHVFYGAGFQDKMRSNRATTGVLRNGFSIITDIVHMEKVLTNKILS